MYRYGLTGVQAVCALGVALILDDDRKLTSRLMHCAAPGCGKFRLDMDIKGRPRKYCSAEHKQLVEAQHAPAKMRKWRKAK